MGQRVAGVQMDGEHLLGTGGDHEVGVLLAWAWLWKKREEEHRQGGRWTAATAIEKRRFHREGIDRDTSVFTSWKIRGRKYYSTL
jgi:hypothetical protein